MLHFYAPFGRLFQASTAFMQGHLLKFRHFRSTTASIEVLYDTAMLLFLEGVPHHVEGTCHSCQWIIAKGNATLQLTTLF